MILRPAVKKKEPVTQDCPDPDVKSGGASRDAMLVLFGGRGNLDHFDMEAESTVWVLETKTGQWLHNNNIYIIMYINL